MQLQMTEPVVVHAASCIDALGLVRMDVEACTPCSVDDARATCRCGIGSTKWGALCTHVAVHCSALAIHPFTSRKRDVLSDLHTLAVIDAKFTAERSAATRVP